MKLPQHKAGLFLEHNDHLNTYMTAQEQIEEWELHSLSPIWKNNVSKNKCIETNEIWTLQWYPNTPIGFHYIAAPTLDSLLEYALEFD